MLNTVRIQGDGVAACCCARLLANRGVAVSFERTARPNLPSLLVSASTQHLMADVFADDHLFDSFPVIRKRVVLWRNQSEPVTLPHAGVVADESILLQRLWGKLEMHECGSHATEDEQGDWLVLSSQHEGKGETHHFGARTAIAYTVELKDGADPFTCWVEALEEGWLFLLPTCRERGSLIAVGDTVQSLLGESRSIVSQVKSVTAASRGFAAYPRVLDPLCGPGWLACGTSAMGFDPICGEGAGNAIREAILVSAALGMVGQDAAAGPVLEHYATRLLGGFLKHLHLCRGFYSCGPDREWWSEELRLLEQGITWTQQKLSRSLRPHEKPRFRLVGFDLQPIESV